MCQQNWNIFGVRLFNIWNNQSWLWSFLRNKSTIHQFSPALSHPAFVFHRLCIEHWSIFVQCRSVLHAITESMRHEEVLHCLDNLWATMRTLVSQSVNPCTQQLDHHYGFFSPGVKSILSIPIQHGHCLGIAIQNHPHDPLISHLDQGGEEKTPRVGMLSNVLPTGTAGQRWAFRLRQ